MPNLFITQCTPLQSSKTEDCISQSKWQSKSKWKCTKMIFRHKIFIFPSHFAMCHAHIRRNSLVSHVETTSDTCKDEIGSPLRYHGVECDLAQGLLEDVLLKNKSGPLTCLRKTLKTMAMAKIYGYYYILKWGVWHTWVTLILEASIGHAPSCRLQLPMFCSGWVSLWVARLLDFR